MDKYSNEQDMAYSIKKEMDKKHLAPWHVIAGKNYSSYVTHEEGYFL